MDLDYSYHEEELISKVRSALANLDASKIPDDTVVQTADGIVVPLLNDIGSYKSEDQDAFDSAVVNWTAEMSFQSWLTFTRLRDREIETFIDPKSYSEGLEYKTNMSLRVLGVTRPPEIPNTVVTIKHDGVKRKVDFRESRVYDNHKSEGSE